MLDRAALLLAEGEVTEFFENPAVLTGIPLVALGIIGLLVVLSPLGFGGREVPEPDLSSHEEGHFTEGVYIKVGLILAAITAIEVAIYYMDLAQGTLVAFLLAFSASKFVLVVLWFMHLRYDSPLFSTLFTGGMLLVAALFVVVLTTLSASLY
jgi:cytochrome c oxidase subunit 4